MSISPIIEPSYGTVVSSSVWLKHSNDVDYHHRGSTRAAKLSPCKQYKLPADPLSHAYNYLHRRQPLHTLKMKDLTQKELALATMLPNHKDVVVRFTHPKHFGRKA